MPNLPRIPQSPKPRVVVILVAVLVIAGLVYVYSVQSKRTKAINLAKTITDIAAQGNATGKENDALAKAKPYMDEALKLDANNAEILVANGYVLEAAGKYQDAINYYDKALKLNPKSGKILFRKAHTLQFLQGNTKEVQDLYNLAYKYDQKDPLILMAQGRKYGQIGELDKAYDFFIYAAKNTKQNDLKAEAYVDAYQVREVQGKFDEARDLASRAVYLDRNYGPGLVYLGMVLAREGKFAEGGAYMLEAASKNPRSSMPYWYLGVLMRLAGNYKQAIIFMNTSLDMIDNDNTILGTDAKKDRRVRVTYDIGKTYYLSGDATKAFAVFADAALLNRGVVSSLLQGDQKRYGIYKNIVNDSRYLALLK